jgi:hypothetical protein
MKFADKEVTGKLILDTESREDWLSLVRGLQLASETIDGPLSGWMFHGTDGYAAEEINMFGLLKSYAVVSTEKDEWFTAEGVHFGTANVAAFFAEDRIESTENDKLALSIFGVHLDTIAIFGTLCPDGQMIDCPLFSRLSSTESEREILKNWDESDKTWKNSLEIFETVIVLGDVSANVLVEFRKLKDLTDYLELNDFKKKKKIKIS